MGQRHVNQVEVAVCHVDGSDDHPGLLWIVSIHTKPGNGFGVTLAYCEEKDDAVRIGEAVAHRNGWSFRLMPEREKV